MPNRNLSWTPWPQVVSLREDVRTGELSLNDFAADLHDVMMQGGTRPIYENPARFFALTFPTFSLRELAKDVMLRLAGKNTKAVRQLELTYGGGKTHTLVTLRHLAHDPGALPNLPAVEQFKSHAGIAPPAARVAALAFDKLDVEKGMEVRGPQGELRWLKHPWSVLAFQIAGAEGLRALHADQRDEERETAPAEPLLVDVLSRPQAEDRGTLVLIDEVLMFARGKVAVDRAWGGRLVDFFQYLCGAVTKVDRCALVASLLASDLNKNDETGQTLAAEIRDIFNRQSEEGVQPVQKDDVAEVLRRRFFTPESIAEPEVFRPHVTKAVTNLIATGETDRKDRKQIEERVQHTYPFHPDLIDLFSVRWTQLRRFQRTRGILRTFAIALRDAERWDTGALAGPNVFLAAPDRAGIAEAARELTSIATQEQSESHGHDWASILEGELAKARSIQDEHGSLKGREIEQAVCAVFLSSQPSTQKAQTRELILLVSATRPDRIELELGLHRWMETSWFLDDNEFETGAEADGKTPLPKAWRLGNRPNLKQMHDYSCTNRITYEAVENRLLEEIRKTKSLTDGTRAFGIHTHMLPDQPSAIHDDGEFHFAILPPATASNEKRPSREAACFIDETTSADRQRVHRNAVVLVAPSSAGLEVARKSVRERLGWEDVQAQLKVQGNDPGRDQLVTDFARKAQRAVPEAIRHAWTIVVTADTDSAVKAFRVRLNTDDPLFATVKSDERIRIQDQAVNTDALLPGGPYDLWRDGEASRRVKDLASAFAKDPRLPKMLRADEIGSTINEGVENGRFVAGVVRPDGSVKTWWRTAIEDEARTDPALEVFLPDKITLSDLNPKVLVPGTLPELWTGGTTTVGATIEYFANSRSVTSQNDGYDEPVTIPACPREAVEAAISTAVQDGSVWLLNEPSSFQGEALPAGVLTAEATLRAPLVAFPVQRLMTAEVPGAWSDGKTTVADLAAALAEREGAPIPWSVMQQTIEGAIAARWLETTSESKAWPCNPADAATVVLAAPTKADRPGLTPLPPTQRQGTYRTVAIIEPMAVQELAEVLDDIITAAAGMRLTFELAVEVNDEKGVLPRKMEEINALLEKVNPRLRLHQ